MATATLRIASGCCSHGGASVVAIPTGLHGHAFLFSRTPSIAPLCRHSCDRRLRHLVISGAEAFESVDVHGGCQWYRRSSTTGLRSRRSGSRTPRFVGSAGGEQSSDDAEPPSEFTRSSELSVSERFFSFKEAFWRFLRPHTIRGTLLGSVALVCRALLENPQRVDAVLLPRALWGIIALLCGNGYIVGINQIYDVEIDRINKPFLPIAAGDLSIPQAWSLVLGLAALGITIVGTNFGPLITVLYFLGLFLGTIYSVPPLHLKRFAVPAFLIIATVRGFLLNFGVYYATRAALGLPFEWNPPIVFITSFVTVFATVIAITKDLPDTEGDRKFKISTFATKLGVRNISFLGSGLILANYAAAIVAAIYLPHCFRQRVMIPAHAILATAVVYQTWLLDSAKYTKDSITGFYQFIWKLFYSEYTLLPFI